jgi:pimeloyl-ACP methyl ester carboxylesterase
MLSLPHRYDHAGTSIAWGSLGQGDPLVLIHGTPFSSQVWRRIAPLLADRWTVYFFDLIGYGQSEMRDGQDVSLGVQNDLLVDMLAYWGLDRPEVLCHDFGGATVLRAYFLNGLRFGRATIIDPVAVAPWGSPFVAHVRKHEAAFVGLPAYAHDALLRAYLQSAAHKTLTEEALAIYMAPWQGTTGQAAFYRQIAQMDQKFTDEIERLYKPLDCATTLLWGEQDQWIPLERGRKLAGLLTDGALRVIPDSGHLVQDDAPEAIIAAMLHLVDK